MVTWTKQIRLVLKRDPESLLKQVWTELGSMDGVRPIYSYILCLYIRVNIYNHPKHTPSPTGAAPHTGRGNRLLEAARRRAQRHPRPAPVPARPQGE